MLTTFGCCTCSGSNTSTAAEVPAIASICGEGQAVILFWVGFMCQWVCRFCQDVHPSIFLSPRVALDSVKLAYNRHACVVCGCGSIWPLKKYTRADNYYNIRRCYALCKVRGAVDTKVTAVVRLCSACLLFPNRAPATQYVRTAVLLWYYNITTTTDIIRII